jgi:hypothetical protein
MMDTPNPGPNPDQAIALPDLSDPTLSATGQAAGPALAGDTAVPEIDDVGPDEPVPA